MGIQANSFTRFFPNAGFVKGLCTLTSGAPVLSALAGNALDDAQVSATDLGTGLVGIVITNFKGPQGFCQGGGNALSGGVVVATSVGTYSTNTATVNFAITDQNNALSDSDFTFTIWAF